MNQPDEQTAEEFKRSPESFASPLALEAAATIAMQMCDNDGIYNGRRAAVAIDQAISRAIRRPAKLSA